MVRSSLSTTTRVSSRAALVLGFIMAGSFLLQYSMVHAWSETFAPPRKSYQDDLDQAYANMDKYPREDQMEEGRANDPEENQRMQNMSLAVEAWERGKNKCSTTNSSEDCGERLDALVRDMKIASVALLGGRSSSSLASTILALVGGSALVVGLGLVGFHYCKKNKSKSSGGGSSNKRAKSSIGGGKAPSKKAASNTGAAGSRSAGPATGSSGGAPTTGTASTGPKSSTGSKPPSATAPK